MQRTRRFTAGVILSLTVAAGILAGCNASEPPAHSGQILSGGVAAIDSVLSANRGKWVVMNVWATWCRPCVAETPDLVAFAEGMRERPLTMLGISTDYFTVDDTAAVRKVTEFQTRYGVPYDNLVFIGSVDDLTDRLNLNGALPTTILFDPSGAVAAQYIGLMERTDLDSIALRIGGV